MKLTKELFDKLYSPDIKKSEYDEIINLINKRFGEVVLLIRPRITYNGGWFVYGNYNDNSENDEGYFDIEEYKKEICIGGNCSFPEPYCFTNQGNGFIPTRWLWTDDNEILEEFNREVERSKRENGQKKLKAKQQRSERKERKAKFKAVISSKLTKEELKYITFK